MSGLIGLSKATNSVSTFSLNDLHRCSRNAGDALMREDKKLGISSLLDAYGILNSYATAYAFDGLRSEPEEKKRWDSAFAAVAGLSVSVMRDREFMSGLISILQGNKPPSRSDTLYVVASGGEYGHRTLFVTLAVGILCSLFYPTVVHGNRSVTGCGCGKFAESDILECLTGPDGTPFPNMPVNGGIDEYVQAQLKKHNFGFAYTQAAFPLFWRFAAARGESGLRDALKVAGTVIPVVGSKYAFVGLWSSDLFGVVNAVGSALYENYILATGPQDQYDELGAEGGVICYKENSPERVILESKNAEFVNFLGTQDQDKAIDEIRWLKEIMSPKTLDSEDPRIRIRREVAVLNTAYALSVLPNYRQKTISSIVREINLQVENGNACRKFEEIKVLSFYD